MLVSRKFTNAEVAERLEHVKNGIRLGMATPDQMEGLLAEAITRLRLQPDSPTTELVHVGEIPCNDALQTTALTLGDWLRGSGAVLTDRVNNRMELALREAILQWAQLQQARQ